MKKKIYMVVLTACLLAILTVGISYAAFYAEISTTNVITIGNIDINLIDIYKKAESVSPGETVSKIVSAENIGNNDAYVRIKLTKTWTKDGEIVQEMNKDYIEINFPNPENWVDGNDGYYYYQKPLKPGETAENLLDSFKLSLNYVPSGIENLQGNIIVSAEAIQVDNFTPEIVEGVITGWGDVEINSNNYINTDNVIAKEEISNVYFQNEVDEFITLPGEDLFLNFKGLMPGDDKIQNIKVANKNNSAIHLYMFASETSEDKFSSEEAKNISDELIKASTIEVIATYPNGSNKVIYSGPVLGKGENFDMTEENAIYLGRYEKDEEATLEVKLHVPEEWTIGGAEGKVDWIFNCVKELDNQEVPNIPVPEPIPSKPNEPSPSLPKLEDFLQEVKTGDNNVMGILIALLLLSTGAIGVIVLKNKKK